MAKDTLSDSGTFFSDDIKIACFTSLSDRLCQILWVPSWVFDVSISWLISGGFEYIALINVWHLLLKSWYKSFSAVCIGDILFISLGFMYLYAWNTSFPYHLYQKIARATSLTLKSLIWYNNIICIITYSLHIPKLTFQNSKTLRGWENMSKPKLSRFSHQKHHFFTKPTIKQPHHPFSWFVM